MATASGIPDFNQLPISSEDISAENLPTPPATHKQDASSRTKPKRPPAVTPRSFTRFFTPRSSQESPKVSTSREALRTITESALNRNALAREQASEGERTFGDLLFDDGPACHANTCPPRKRRRLSHAAPAHHVAMPEHFSSKDAIGQPQNQKPIIESDSSCRSAIPTSAPLPIRMSRLLNSTGNLLCRSLYGVSSSRGVSAYDCSQGWKKPTSNFYSRPEDLHVCDSLPFCATSCNTNSLVAVGDEEGGVRLLESGNSKGDDAGFSKAWLVFQPHANAILDLQFSSDDKLLATASGDQTTIIVDMLSQTSICTLSRHASSVKQVRFQPESGDTIVATSSRDGNVNIWDLRSDTRGGPVLGATTPFDPDIGLAQDQRNPPAQMRWATITDQVRGGHTGAAPKLKGRNHPKPTPLATNPSKPDSITSLEFLRPQVFITGSESNACVKVWDMRISYSHRRGQAMPVSTTRQPESHQNHRQFGLTSMTLSGDKARLYTVCRDNTLYAYSTSHLILGHAPELYAANSRPRRYGDMDHEGLGPLYGFRHPRFHVATFYIKSSLRKAGADNTELLAVGSSDSCAILFPTDERILARMNRRNAPDIDPDQPKAPSSKSPARPSLSRSSSGLKLSTRLADTIPIYTVPGTSLTAGHQKEVGGLAWTHDGALVTVSDDFRARCWREGADARELRKGGEVGGARWGCGWAEVEDSDSDVE